jgi:hypothetical protein
MDVLEQLLLQLVLWSSASGDMIEFDINKGFEKLLILYLCKSA